MSENGRGGPLGRRGIWTAGLGQVAALLVFVAAVFLLAPALPPSLSSGWLVAAGTVVAAIPALAWLAFFYQQDRLEPEPKNYIIRVFILGALVAQAIGIPLVKQAFDLNHWLYTDTWTHLLGSVLVVGMIQEFLIYAVVRYSVFPSPEFDERTDGVIYATVAALGFVTMLNIDYVVSRGGVDLGVGAVRVTVAALAHASIAGIMGYFMGQAKFEHTPAYYLPAGVALAAILNGLFFFAQDQVTARGLTFNPTYGLAAAVAFAIILLGIVRTLIRRSIGETVMLGAPPPAAEAPASGGGGE